MATICFGPPPLPPNKKSSVGNFVRNRKHHHNPLLSSTYLSFRDPAEENEIVVVTSEEIELASYKMDKADNTFKTDKPFKMDNFFKRTNSFKTDSSSRMDNSSRMDSSSRIDNSSRTDNFFRDNFSGDNFSRDNFSRNNSFRDNFSRDNFSRDNFSRDNSSRDNFSRDNFSRDNSSRDNLRCDNYKMENSYNLDNPFASDIGNWNESTKEKQRSRRVSHTNSLSRNRNSKATLVRSQSDGNLDKKGTVAPMTINKYVKMLSGSWKNLLNLGGMSRPPKPAATVKKVPPPAVPHEFRHSGSSFGSAGYASSEDAGFLPTSDPPGVPRDDHSDYGSTVSGSTGKSPGPVFPAPTFTFPGQPPPGAVLTHKAAVYYHHQLSLQEDQGIDMTQSPGRDSPGSSSGSAGSGSRHSTASLDSGRASYHPLSNAGRSTIGSANSPRCSLSSCSIGSEQGRIERMILQGVPDHEIINAWLTDLQFEEYVSLFLSAGYDLPTICRMTPEDLTAIGIKKPNHRKRLKAEIAQLNLQDNLPNYIPGSLEEWLQLLRLEEYQPAFLDQGYHTVDDVTQLTWEDLEEFGMVKLGHQKKIMLAIKRIKDIRAGKRFNTIDMSRLHSQQDVVVHAPLGPPSPGVPAVHSTFRSFHQPWEIDQTRQLAAGTHYMQPMYCTDIVPIKIRTGRGKSLESLEDPNERTHHTFSSENTQTFYYQQPAGWRVRSYDDGDITPTNETALMYEGGGTLPRPRGVIRPRPIAKVQATTRDPFPDFEKPQFNPEKYSNPQYKTLPRDLIDTTKYHMQYSSPLMGKKLPPSPPKRQLDSCNEGPETTTVEIHHVQTSSPLPLPAYPSSDSLSISLDSQGDLPLPPPPAPGTPPGASQPKLNSSRSWGAEEQELINTLALQHRNGSDASFKSSSSTESDSLPFANENAGTIRTRAGGRPAEYASPAKSRTGLPPHPSPTPNRQARNTRSEPADVLNDIGNMLANLTDELDAMLEKEKRHEQ